MNVTRIALCLSSLLAADAAAQSTITVPPGIVSEANSRGNIAGFSQRFRQQLIVRGQDLAAANNRWIDALWFRRDFDFGKSYAASSPRVRLQLSHAATSPLTASPRFAANAGAGATLVHDGPITLPAVNAPQQGAPWTAAHAVRIAFSTSFFYRGGDLCVEIDGDPAGAPGFYWSVDYLHEADGGVVTPIGSACGLATNEYPRTAGAWGRNMLPGGTFTITTFGQAASPAILLFGAPAATAISLGFLQATGCSVYVQPLTTMLGSYPGGSGYVAWHAPFTLPTASNLLGGTFAVQGVNLEVAPPFSNPAGLTTTNGLSITLARRLPRGSITQIVSASVNPGAPLPSSGRVEIGRGPVMRLELR